MRTGLIGLVSVLVGVMSGCGACRGTQREPDRSPAVLPADQSRGWQRATSPFEPDPREVEAEQRSQEGRALATAEREPAAGVVPGERGAGDGRGGGRNRASPVLVADGRPLPLDAARLARAGLADRQDRQLLQLVHGLAPGAKWGSLRLQRQGQEAFLVPRAALEETPGAFVLSLSGRGQLRIRLEGAFGPARGQRRPLERIELIP